jgi:hypothetical protein
MERDGDRGTGSLYVGQPFANPMCHNRKKEISWIPY